MGAGIAGLTAALELAERGFKVTIVERNNAVGGLARSIEDTNPKKCPQEFSWRAFGPYYHNMYNLLSRIGASDNLSVLVDKSVTTDCNAKNTLTVRMGAAPIRDRAVMLSKALTHFTSCDARATESANENWSEYLASRKVSQDTYNHYVRPLGPLLGFDNDRASTYDVLRHAELFANDAADMYSPGYKFTNIPTGMALFQPLVKRLTTLGVVIILDATITKINVSGGIVTSVNANVRGRAINYKASRFVCALSLETVCGLLTPELTRADPNLLQLNELSRLGRQVQLSVQYYLDRPVYTKVLTDYLYLEESPWALIIIAEGAIWGKKINLADYCDPAVKEIWSVGVCETHKPGLLHKKPFVNCNEQEIREEVWYQVLSAKGIYESVCGLKDAKVLDFKMWPSFYYRDGKMDTTEPKFANNVGTKPLRPGYRTMIPNLYIGAAYCDTTVGVHSMEGAVEAGKNAASSIMQDCNINNDIYIHNHGRSLPLILGPVRAIDSIMYSMGLPHIGLILLLIIIVIYAACIYIAARAVKNLVVGAVNTT